MRSRSMATRHRNNGSGPGEAFIANTSVRENCSADLVSGHREADRAYHDPGDSAALRRPKKCISDLARSALANGLAQVVIVGAGFAPLSYELQRDFPTGEFWEIDHPATQRHKVRACSEIGIERVHYLAVDLSATGVDRETLINTRFDPAKRTFWIAEGLLMYFPADIVLSLIRT